MADSVLFQKLELDRNRIYAQRTQELQLYTLPLTPPSPSPSVAIVFEE